MGNLRTVSGGGLGRAVQPKIGHGTPFGFLVGIAFFIDRLRIGVEGERLKSPRGLVTLGRNRQIGGPDRPYAWAVDGISLLSGNPFQLRFGHLKKYKYLPSLSLDLRSEAAPLTLRECESVLDGLLRSGFRHAISYIELTADLDVTYEFLRQRFVSRATYFRELEDDFGNRTFYVGSPHSPWQFRVYEKAPGVVRIEFVFRGAMLRSLGIDGSDNVAALRDIDLARFVRFCELSKRGLERALAGAQKPWVREMLVNWRDNRPLQLWAQIARQQKNVDINRFLHGTEIQKQLRQMLRSLVW